MKMMIPLLIFVLAGAGCGREKHVVEGYPTFRAVQNGIDMFEVDMGFYPFTVEDLLTTNGAATWHSTTGPWTARNWR
jgi:hypothetical protein